MNNQKKRPLILIANDDGYRAKGIRELEKVVTQLGHVIVMAPDSARSGFSTAITSEQPVSYKKISETEGLEVYGCTGTPADCIKLALMELAPEVPDLILSGINHGSNAGINAHYSGTMGAAFEGCMKRIPSIGFSLCDHNPDADFTPLYPWIKEIIQNTLRNGLPEGICLNVNFPEQAPYKGLRVCTQDIGVWENEWFKTPIPPRNKEVFWITGSYRSLKEDDEQTDNWALDHGYVAVTPLQIDMSAHTFIQELDKQLNR